MEKKAAFKAKTFQVADKDGGRTLTAEQLATFTHVIGHGAVHRFVVTKLPGEQFGSVTHRASGAKVCSITYLQLAACKGDHRDAGHLALNKLIEKFGESRVASALRTAEFAQHVAGHDKPAVIEA